MVQLPRLPTGVLGKMNRHATSFICLHVVILAAAVILSAVSPDLQDESSLANAETINGPGGVWNKSLVIVLSVFLAVIIFALIIILVICGLRYWGEKACPCLSSRVAPEEKTQWYHVNRYGETKLKFVRYNMRTVLEYQNSREPLISGEVSRSVPTDASHPSGLDENGHKKLPHNVSEVIREEDEGEEIENSDYISRERSKRRKRTTGTGDVSFAVGEDLPVSHASSSIQNVKEKAEQVTELLETSAGHTDVRNPPVASVYLATAL